MLRKTVISLTLLALLGFACVSGAAEDPTLHQVYEAAQAGRLNEAQAMMDIVLRDHPNSAKAHFVEAELLARQGQLAKAGSELNTAERLAPGLPFEKPQAVDALRNRIASSANASRLSPAPQAPQTLRTEASSGIPWGMLLFGGGLIAAIIYFARAMGRRNASTFPTGMNSGYAPQGAAPGGAAQAYGAGGMAPPMGSSGAGIGSGIMGGLATGAALGAGMVAGEALMHHFTDGNRGSASAPPPVADSWDSPASNNMGGADFGVNDSSSWDDSSGGGGGDDWG